MFDFGFGELLLLAVIALVVLGPERLPVAARLLGRWIRAARSQWNSVKAELENELADEELRRNLRDAADAARNGAQQMRALVEQPAPTTPSSDSTEPAGTPTQHESEQVEVASGESPAEPAPAQLSLLGADAGSENASSRKRADG